MSLDQAKVQLSQLGSTTADRSIGVRQLRDHLVGTSTTKWMLMLLGAVGILAEYSAMRHMANLESVYTYEGTHDVHSLVLGQALTGLSAFK